MEPLAYSLATITVATAAQHSPLALPVELRWMLTYLMSDLCVRAVRHTAGSVVAGAGQRWASSVRKAVIHCAGVGASHMLLEAATRHT
jgi:hypothetical protein